MAASPRIDLDRLLGRLDTFNRIGALPGGGNCRLALSDDDRAGRDLLVQWMRELGLAVTIDAIGNIIGVRGGREDDGRRDVRLACRYGRNRRPLRRSLRRARRPRSLPGAQRCRHRHAPAAGAGGLHQRRGLALSALCDGQPGLCRRPRARGCLRDPRHRRRNRRRGAAAHRLCGRRQARLADAARLSGIAYRAGADPGG